LKKPGVQRPKLTIPNTVFKKPFKLFGSENSTVSSILQFKIFNISSVEQTSRNFFVNQQKIIRNILEKPALDKKP
jgi:hypothetical protein